MREVLVGHWDSELAAIIPLSSSHSSSLNSYRRGLLGISQFLYCNRTSLIYLGTWALQWKGIRTLVPMWIISHWWTWRKRRVNLDLLLTMIKLEWDMESICLRELGIVDWGIITWVLSPTCQSINSAMITVKALD